MIIGITGSIGSGKTTAANLFRKYGFRIINVDKFYANIYRENKSLKNKIKKEFGTTSRNKLKKIVFNDYKKLKKLNQITHPIIINEIKKSIKNIKKNKKTEIIIDAPLLLETKTKNLVDKVIVVKCNEKTQISRVLKKKKYTGKEIKNIIKSQMPLNKKLKYADFVVENNGNINNLEKQIKDIVKKLK
jgi:dephospho-CoA kinase